MKIIDAHIHFSEIQSFHEVSNVSKVDYSKKGFKKEFQGVTAIGMGLTETSNVFPSKDTRNPMTLDLDKNPENLYVCLGFNPLEPFCLDTINPQDIERVVGLKIYAGYYHYHVHDKVYYPLYDFAKKHQLPVVIHSGDTFSDQGRLKFSHPLEVDELAFFYPDVTFIIAHFGDP